MKLRVTLIFLFVSTCNFVSSIRALRDEELMQLPRSDFTLLWVNTLTEYILINEKRDRNERTGNGQSRDYPLRRRYILTQFRKFRRIGRAKNYLARNDVYRNTLKRRSSPPPIRSDFGNDV